MNNEEIVKRVERETRELIGDQAIQIMVLRAALEMAKPWPKDGKIPPQPDLEDHPPMDWPKDKKWPPENMEDYPGRSRRAPDAPPPDGPLPPLPDGLPQRQARNGKAQTMNG